jgi:hypothetical protein
LAQFEFRISEGVIPMRPRFYQWAEGSPLAHGIVAGDLPCADPSLRLRNGCDQDDTSEATTQPKFRLSHYRDSLDQDNRDPPITPSQVRIALQL